MNSIPKPYDKTYKYAPAKPNNRRIVEHLTPSKQMTCPANSQTVCGTAAPYQCLSGSAINGCAASSSTWDNSSACTSYCNIQQQTPPRTTRNITVKNNCPKTVWVGTYGNSYIPAAGGFELGSNSTKTIQVPSNWNSGRIWGRTGCVPGSNGMLTCETGDCNGQFGCLVTGQPPASLAEFNLSNDPTIPDYYDISLVDGFNLPISVAPVAGSYQYVNNPSLGKFNCGSPSCSTFDVTKCPPELTMKGQAGTYCASACTAVNNINRVANPAYLKNFNKALVCCSCDCGANCGCSNANCKYGCSPLDTDANHLGGRCYISQWPIASTGQTYNQVFKDQCPDAYSWQFDDESSTYQCANADYQVSFC